MKYIWYEMQPKEKIPEKGEYFLYKNTYGKCAECHFCAETRTFWVKMILEEEYES